MNGQIIITATDKGEGTNVGVDMRMLDVDITDKMLLLHSMVSSLEMSSLDLRTFIIAEFAEVFDGANITRIDRGTIEEVLKDHP